MPDPTYSLLLVDVDSQDGGNCQVAMTIDTVTVKVLSVDYFNTSTTASATFSVTNTKGQVRQVSISPNTPQSSVTPPFAPGNWTPGVVQNTSGSGPPYQGDGSWSVSFTGWR